MSFRLSSLKGGYVGDYIGEYSRADTQVRIIPFFCEQGTDNLSFRSPNSQFLLRFYYGPRLYSHGIGHLELTST